MRSLIFCTLFAVSAALMGADHGAYSDIAHADLVKVVETKSAVVVDVNGSDSWKEGHIPGAIDYNADKAKLAEKLPADKSTLIVAYCGSPKCGAWKEAADAIAKLGYTNVKHYTGGISGWKEAKAPLEKGG